MTFPAASSIPPMSPHRDGAAFSTALARFKQASAEHQLAEDEQNRLANEYAAEQSPPDPDEDLEDLG